MCTAEPLNPSYDNPKRDEHSPKSGKFAFYQKIASKMKQADIGDMFKKGLQECLYVNHFGISRPLVSYSINIISYEGPVKHRRGL